MIRVSEATHALLNYQARRRFGETDATLGRASF